MLTAKARNTIVGLAEKTIATYLQAFVGMLFLGGQLNASVAESAAIAAIPAALTVVANGLPAVSAGLPFWADLILRTVRTYVAAYLGFLISMPVFTLDRSTAVAAMAAAVAAAMAALKAAVGARIGLRYTAAWLPASLDPESSQPPVAA